MVRLVIWDAIAPIMTLWRHRNEEENNGSQMNTRPVIKYFVWQQSDE